MKLHIGCGRVYLIDWINVDLRGPNTVFASAEPDLVKLRAVREEDYYGGQAARIEEMLKERWRTAFETKMPPPESDMPIIIDVYGSFQDLPFATATVKEILTRQAFEHLSITEARRGLAEMARVMEDGAILRIDVPDMDEAIRLIMEKQDPAYAQQVLGPRRGDFGYHCMGYTKVGLIKLIQEHEFFYLHDEPNPHFYPSICIRGFRKPRSE